jgi:ABC-type nitrate/sulfonate/bicarbonate transport system substrate-binding protein
MIAMGLGLWAAITIAVAGPATSPEYLPVHVAHAEGYFAQEKLEVTLRIERTEGDAARALGRGQADLAATSVDAAYRQGHLAGNPPLLLFGLTAAAPVAIMVAPSHKDTIRSPANLRGQPVGLSGAGTPEQAMLASVLAQVGVRLHQLSVQSFGERRLVGALEEGQVAAAVMVDPWITRLAEEGKVTILVDLRKRDAARRWLGAETVHAAVFVRPGSTLGDRELTALARALLRAVAHVTLAPPEAFWPALPAAVRGSREDFAIRVNGAREAGLPRGRVTEEMLKVSVEQARDRAPLPAALKLPLLRWYPLVLTGPLRNAQQTP